MTSILTILLLLTIAVVIWLTISFRRLQSRYLLFTGGIKSKTLDEILTRVLQENKATEKALVELRHRCATIEKDGLFHIQRIGLLRFNPFKDTGGDQSFILTLVDAFDTGIVITALYARSGMRWYAKRVVKGKGVEHELSEEEKKALAMAQKV